MTGAPTGAEELCRIADRFAFIYPDEAMALMRIADEHRRMSEALDEIVTVAFGAMRLNRNTPATEHTQ